MRTIILALSPKAARKLEFLLEKVKDKDEAYAAMLKEIKEQRR